MGRYSDEDYETRPPCRDGKHNWAMNGTCWRCGWTEGALRAALPAPVVTAHVLTAARLAQAEAFLDAWCTAAEDGEALGPLRAQTLAWLGGGG